MQLDIDTLEALRRQHPDQLRARPRPHDFAPDGSSDLLAHRPQWTEEPQPTLRDLTRLRPDERALYDDLRWLRLTERPLRLEQERIDFALVAQAVARAVR